MAWAYGGCLEPECEKLVMGFYGGKGLGGVGYFGDMVFGDRGGLGYERSLCFALEWFGWRLAVLT